MNGFNEQALLQWNPRWCHEARHRGVLSRNSVLKTAKEMKEKGDAPSHPIGPHFIDIGVKGVNPNEPVVIIEGAASGATKKLNGIVEEPINARASDCGRFPRPAPRPTFSCQRRTRRSALQAGH